MVILDVAALERLPQEAIPEAIGEIARAQAILLARLATERSPVAGEGPKEPSDEQLLTAHQVAERLQVSVRWAYRHAGRLGAVKLSENKLRFPESALRRYLKTQRK